MVVRGKKTESDKGSAEKKTVSLKDDNRSANEKTSDKIKE